MAEVSRAEAAAMRGEPMPTGSSWQEMAEYIAMRALHWGYRHKVFTREEASAMKQRLRSELDNVERGYAFERKCWDNAARRYKETERAKTAYRKERTLTAADALVAVLDGLGND